MKEMNNKTPKTDSKADSKTKSSLKNKIWFLPLISGLVMLLVGFGLGSTLGGRGKGGAPNNRGGQFSQQDGFNGGPQGDMGGNMQGRMIGNFGEVTAVSESSITIKNPRSEQEQTFTINSETKVTDDGESSTTSSIKVGDTVAIRTSDSNSTTATQITLNLNLPNR